MSSPFTPSSPRISRPHCPLISSCGTIAIHSCWRVRRARKKAGAGPSWEAGRRWFSKPARRRSRSARDRNRGPSRWRMTCSRHWSGKWLLTSRSPTERFHSFPAAWSATFPMTRSGNSSRRSVALRPTRWGYPMRCSCSLTRCWCSITACVVCKWWQMRSSMSFQHRSKPIRPPSAGSRRWWKSSTARSTCPRSTAWRKCNPPRPRSNTTQAEYEAIVVAGKEFINAGDIFQFVPSQRFEADFDQPPVDLYRALRFVNPSPYMFILELGDFALVGSSPEVHVRSINGRIDIRPIAGTRPRGKTPEEDDALAEDLMSRSQGTRRAPDARRSSTERRRPDREARQGERGRLHDRRALQPRHAHRFQCLR